MSDRATLWRLLQEHKEDAILRLFDTVQNEHDAQVAALQAALEEEGRRNAVFTACLHKAQNLYLEAHPDYPGWPDGAVNITWVLEAFDKERAEVKRLQAALREANTSRDAVINATQNCISKISKWGYSTAGQTLPVAISDAIADLEYVLTDEAHRARVGGAS